MYISLNKFLFAVNYYINITIKSSNLVCSCTRDFLPSTSHLHTDTISRALAICTRFYHFYKKLIYHILIILYYINVLFRIYSNIFKFVIIM